MHTENQAYQDYLNLLNTNRRISLGLRLEELAVFKPRHTAIICHGDEFTYSEWNEEANRYSAFFAAAGYQRGDVIALMMDNSVHMLAMVAALSKLGIISALINTKLRKESLARDINLCEAKAIVLDSECAERIVQVEDYLRLWHPGEMMLLAIAGEEVPAGFIDIRQKMPPQAVNPPSTPATSVDETLAYLFTSGSGGHRKTVPINNMRWLMAGKALEVFTGLTSDRVQYLCLPLYLSGGFNACFAGMVISGSTLVMAKRFSASTFWSDIDNHGADYFFGVGEMFHYIYNQDPVEADRRHPLKTIISNGLTPDLIEPFKQRFGVQQIIETYNTTENIGTFINVDEIPGMCGNLNLGGIRQGELVQFDEEKEEILTDDQGRAIACSPDDVGLLLCTIYHYNNFPGYINDPSETEKVILRDVFTAGDQYFHTQDLMQLHAGDHLSFQRRLGDIYRWKGRTISATKVSDAIKKFFGAVDDAFVFNVTVPGYKGYCGMAVVSLIPGEKLNWTQFNDYLKRRLPAHEIPLFLRLTEEEFLDDGLKQKYREEGANPETKDESSPDEIYVFDHAQGKYIELNEEIYAQILDQGFAV